LRLSAGQLNRLNNEFKIICNEYEEAKRKIQEYEVQIKRINGDGEAKIKILTQ
jgi:hypothetical protein